MEVKNKMFDDYDDYDEDDFIREEDYEDDDFVIEDTRPRCKDCGCPLDEDNDFYLEPYPHLTCPRCGEWYPLF